jgi:Peptidase family C25/Fibronectin type III domain
MMMKAIGSYMFRLMRKPLLMVVVMTTVFALTTVTSLVQSSKPEPAQTPAVMPACDARIDGKATNRVTPGQESPPLEMSQAIAPSLPSVASNYSFNTATNASLTDMSSGTTQLLAPNIDDTASALTNIGFDFYFQGARFTQFSINENGVVRLGATAQSSTPYKPLAQAGIPIITAYGADQRTHAGDGKVHFKVIGSAPNRVLVVEWLNNQSTFNTGGTADLTYQVRLAETTGVIELVYGSMTMSTAGAADPNSRDPNIGFSSSNIAGTVGSVTAAQSGTPAPTFDGASVTAVANLYTAGAITVLTSAANGSRRIFSFTPPTPTAPTGLNFTSVTQLAMTLNWTDSPDETLYAVYRSTDNVNFSFDGTAAQNATSYNATGLSPGTTYFWRVFAVSEGALSAALSGSQATNAAGVINSTAAGGLWSSTATWVGGVLPGAGDNVTIVNGATVTIDTAAVALSVTVGQGTSGILQYETTTARTLTVGQSVTVATNGVLQSAATGTVTTHVLSVGGDLTNNGTIDFSTNANTAAAGIIFTGATDAAFTLGASSTTDLKQTAGVTLNKGTNNTPVLTFTPGGTFTVLGANAVGFLTITTGTFKLSGANAFSNPVFNAAAYSIPAAGGFWMNNANATVVGLNGSPTVTGMFRMSQGTFNIGIATGNSMGFASGSNINVEGGTINATGRFGVAASGNAITYNQTGGTITVCTIGNASTTLASFDLGTGVGTTNISGGTIIVQLANTAVSGPRDFRNQSGLTGIITVTGGTVQLGNAASGAAKAFSIAGVFPNLVISNASAGHSATFLAPAVFNNISLNITINTGTTLNIGNNVFLMNGATLTNNGTLTANGASSNFVWFLTTAPQLYTGSGTVTAPVTNFAVQADLGLTIDAASSNIVVGALRLFSGNVTNANKITLGNGGATTGIVQIGNTTTPTAAGVFDVPLTFNLGTGGQTLSYLRTTLTRTTGPEVNPTRTVTTLTYDDNDATHTLTIAGGDLTVTGATTLTNGRIVTNANTLAVGSAGTVTRTNGFVDGNFRKTYTVAASKSFEVGTANGFSPVTANVTAASFPADVTVKAVQGPQPNIGQPSHALQRYWKLTATGVTADLTFSYLDPTDIPVTAVEANFVIVKYDGTFTQPGGSVNTAANTATITGATTLTADWTLAGPAAPTDVALNGFAAEGLAPSASAPQGGVLLRWQTGLEVANLGFNIYRDEAGKRTRVNPNLIAGSAFFVGARTVLGAGRSYVWRDTQGLKSDAQYWLEAINLSGYSSWHGPLNATMNKSAAPTYEPNARLISDLSGDEHADTATQTVERYAKVRRVTAAAVVKQQGLANDSTIKILINREGWYQVKAADLIAAGLDARVNPQMLQLFVDGREQPISVATNKDGTLSAIEFYGTGVDNPYTRERAYWLVVGQTGRRIVKVTSPGNPAPGGSFLATVERRDRSLYFSSLRNGERENFFGAVIARDAVDQTLMLARVNNGAAGTATLEVSLQGATLQPHIVQVEINGHNLGTLTFGGQAAASASFDVAHALLREGANTVRLTPMSGSGDVSLVDYLRLSYQHYNTADGDALRFIANGKQAVTIDGFSKSTVRVLDITDANAVQELVGAVQSQGGGYGVSLTVPGTGQRTLLAVASDLAKPASVTLNTSSSWRQPANGADLVVITRREFAAALDPLVGLRRQQGLGVAVVDIEDVYDEFSFGQKTPQAVRDFLLYAATSWKKKPHYVLLAAEASYDPKGYLGLGDLDMVPTRLFDSELLETATDDWFVDFNNDGVPELAIGRLPARTANEALVMATKIARYDSQSPAESLLLVSDMNDTFDFTSASESLRGLIPADLRAVSLHRGDVDDQTLHGELIAAINGGQRLVNYVGHGSVELWRGSLLTAGDVSNLTNNGQLTMFVMMTCLNGFYHDPALDSLGAALLKSERGGAAAVWASSGMTLPDAQAVMNQEAYRQLFSGQRLTIGDVMTRAKAVVANGDVRRTWILLGDPTMRLR